MIVWLASYPRSGNTFARLVLQQMYGVSLPTVYEQNLPQARPPRPAMFPELRNNITLDTARGAAEPMLVKTHECSPDDAPAIYLARDGRDALVSHAHYVLCFERDLDAANPELFRETLARLVATDDAFGGWSNNVQSWLARRGPTAVVHFADLIASPAAALRAAVAALQLPLVERCGYRLPEFTELHERAPKFFRRGGIGAWRDEMPRDLHEVFWQRHGEAMRALGYDCETSQRLSTSAA